MAVVYVSPKAVEDLDGIKDYIENSLKSPHTAKLTVLKIIGTYEKLADYPELGSELQGVSASLRCYRHLKSGNYIIFYRLNDGNVYVIRVLHKMMDFLKILVL